MARELGIDINDVPGTGSGGRISAEDVKTHVNRLVGAAAPGASGAEPLPDFSRWGAIERLPMRGIRRKTAAAPFGRMDDHSTRDAARSGRRHGARRASQALRPSGGGRRRKPDGHRDRREGGRVGAEGLPAVQRLGRHGGGRNHPEAVRPHRRRRGYRSRPARAGHSRRRYQEHRSACRRAVAALRESAQPEAVARGDAGRLLQHLESRRHRRHGVHPDRQHAGSRRPRHLARTHRGGLSGRRSSCRA